MKRFWIVIVLVAIAAVFFGFKSIRTVSPAPPAGMPGTTSPTGTSAKSPLITRPAPSFQAKDPGAVAGPIAVRAASPGTTTVTNGVPVSLAPRTVLENVRTAVRSYGSMFGGNPVGTNPEITAALMGNNPKQINFVPADSGLQVNDRGELVDAWGTPFFFHQISGSETEIRSAGPDRKMWTGDDVVAK